MATIKEIIDIMPDATQKEMYQELKGKFEEKPVTHAIDQSLKDFVKTRNEAKNNLKK